LQLHGAEPHGFSTFVFFGVTDNHRHVQAAAPTPVDAAGIESAVVGEENDDGG
jgi:hypothetical protein